MNNNNFTLKRVLSLFVAVGASNFALNAQIISHSLPPQYNYVWNGADNDNAIASDVDNPTDYKLTVISPSVGSTELKFEMTGYNARNVQTNLGNMQVIEMKGGHPMLIKGTPDLPQLTAPILIPNTGNTVIEYLDVQYTDVEGVEVAPSKGNLSRTIDPATLPYWKGAAYSQNDFYPAKQAVLDNPYVLRDCRGQALHIRPMQYNPVTKTLRVLTSITVRIVNVGGQGENELTSTQLHPDREFNQIYKRHFVNFGAEKTAPLAEIGGILIISNASYMAAMQPYVNWKIRKGIPTEMVSVATVGNTTTAIKTYITNYYGNHNLKYVLLVGDLAQVTSPTLSGGKSDPSYGYLTGSDSYGEVIVGRFSAESVTHVNTQVTKVLTYEINPPMGNTRFDHQTNIASNQGPGDNNEMDWEHERLIRTKLMTYGYADYNEFYDSDHQAGGNDLAGDPTAANIVAEVNSGTGIINYTGHGSATSWGTSGFSNTQINNSLTNTSIWPFICSVGCVNGEFDNGTCFGETWLRATHNGLPSGAIAAFMSSINQSWNPPMAGQDGTVDIIAGNLDPASIFSFGGLMVNGCYYMNDVYDAAGDEMTNTWHCFGDPSIIVRTKDPLALTASHVPTTPLGTSSLAVTCNTEGALVAITQNNVILGTGYVSGGTANVTITPISTTDTIRVTATAFNTKPYLGNVLVTSNAGPFVVLQTNQLIDNNPGNNDGIAEYGEGINVSVSLQNTGTVQATNITVKLRTTNPNVTITDSTYSIAAILPQTTTALDPAFSFNVSTSVADQTLASFTMEMTDGTNTWSSNLNVMLNAPVLSVPTVSVSDATGNNNGRIDAGETATITFGNLNSGHSTSLTAVGTLNSGDVYVTENNNTDNVGILAVSANGDATFGLTAGQSTPVNHWVTFNYSVDAGAYSATRTAMVKVNMLVEDMESGDYNAHDWTQSGTMPWTIDNVVKYESDYSSKSGDIVDSQTSTMTLALNVLQTDTIAFFKKLSCEQDWDFLNFYIDGVQKGSWSGLVDWERVAFPVTTGTHTFTWTYAKDNAYSENEDAVWVDFIELPNSDKPLAVNESNSKSGSLSIYPNPASGSVTLLIDTKSKTASTLNIYNTMGQLVVAETIPAQQQIYNTDISNLANGIYTLVVRNGNNVLHSRLVVK